MKFSVLQAAWLARAAELGYSLIRDSIPAPAETTDPEIPKDIADTVLQILEKANTEGKSLLYKPLVLIDGNSVAAITHPLDGAPRGVEPAVVEAQDWIEINGVPVVALS